MHRLDRVFSLPGPTMLRPLHTALVALQARNSLQQNENGSLDTRRGTSFNSASSGVPVALIGQKGIRCAAPFGRQGKSGAAPATVGGESFSHVPLDLAMQGLGRRRRAATREPGDLPQRGHPSHARRACAGRASAVVTKRLVTRMEAATIMLAHFPPNNARSPRAIERRAITTLRSAWPRRLWLAASIAAICIVFTEAAEADDTFVTKASVIPFIGLPSLNGPAYNWNGFYAGGLMGLAWGQSNWTGGPGISGTTNLFQPINSFDEGGSFFFGLQGGYNYVLPNRILLGAEADVTAPSFQTLTGISIGGGSNFTSPTLGAVNYSETVLSSGTVRGRIGYAPGSWLFYATGGFAWTYNQQTFTQFSTGNSVSPFLWRLGWMAGAGVEVPIPVAPHWTARLEYLFTDYGTNSKTFFGTQAFNSNFELQELRFGLNYQFGNGAVPASAPIVNKDAAAPAADILSLHGQTTFVYQGYPTIRSPFLGPNSLPAAGNARETFDLTLFAGLRL